jgi:dienelactone hydrolase
MSIDTVHFPGHRSEPIRGLLARPDPAPAGRSPALVLVHEAFGLDAHITKMTRRFADEGYVVLAPDLYSREGLPGPKPAPGESEARWTKADIRSAFGSLPDRRVLGDLEAALAFLARDPGVDPDRLGATGFCMGGNYAFLLGCHSRRLRAVADFYGRFIYHELDANKPVQPLDLAINLSCPLLAIFGALDPAISLADIELLRETLARSSRDFTIEVLPGAGHGFFNERRASYDAAASARAWSLATRFLREHLRPEGE